MGKFKINAPLSKNSGEEEIKAELFGRDAEKHLVKNDYAINAKPTKSFTIPLTEQELLFLQKVAQKYDRSQRYIARKLLVKVLIAELDDA